MKYLIILLMCLYTLTSCSSKGDFVEFYPDSYFYLTQGTSRGDPLTRTVRLPGGDDYNNFIFSVYRADIVAIAETKDVMGNDSYNYIDIPVHLTFFTLHITYDYTNDVEIDQYVKSFATGTETHQKYGIPVPQVGDTVILSEMCLEIATDYGMTVFFYVVPDENGVEYCYAPHVDTSCFTGGIELVGEERHVYKKGRDDDIIKYLEENNIRMPEMTHKFKLEDLVPQLIELNRPRNEAVENGTLVDDENVKQRYQIEYDYGEEGDSE